MLAGHTGDTVQLLVAPSLPLSPSASPAGGRRWLPCTAGLAGDDHRAGCRLGETARRGGIAT